MSYETSEDGRLAPEQYGIALSYLRKLQAQINDHGNSALVDKIAKEMFAFSDTLPEADKEEATITIIAENLGF